MFFFTFHLNIQSLSKQYDEFLHFLYSLKYTFTVIALTESWLNNNMYDFFKLTNYQSCHSVRQNRPGCGGLYLCLLVN